MSPSQNLSADGQSVAWTSSQQVPIEFGSVPSLAADQNGHAYLALFTPSGQGQVIRFNATGTAAEYTETVSGWPTSIAVDESGAAFVAGYGTETGIFLAKLNADGSPGFYSTVPQPQVAPTVALDRNGNAVIQAGGVLMRFDLSGAITFSKTVATWALSYPELALDAAGNAYITGSSISALYPVRNSLAPCGSDLLSVIAPDGSVLETTYVPGPGRTVGPLVAIGQNSAVLVVDAADPSFAPTRTGPFNASEGADFLWQLSPNAAAEIFPLACLGNAATYGVGPVAPGSLFTLFGNGLGPAKGVQLRANSQSPFPISAAGVEVMFDGKPAPLLWVQDSQINLVVPWSLTPGHVTEVCASYNGVKAQCLNWPVAEVSPGLFSVDGVYAAAVNEDGTPNSATNPAAPGSIVSVYATGLGPINPPQPDGTLVGFPLPKQILPVAAATHSPGTAGAGPPVRLDVTYRGPAPFLVAGATQINFKVLSNMNDVFVTVANTQSPALLIYVADQ